jgi:hypothetical protein
VLVSDSRHETWRRLRIAVIVALLTRKDLVPDPGAVTAASNEDSMELAWKRIAKAARPVKRIKWSPWARWWGRK